MKDWPQALLRWKSLRMRTRAVPTWPNFLAFYGIKWGLPSRSLSITLKAFASRRHWELSGIRFRNKGNGWKCYHFLESQSQVSYLDVGLKLRILWFFCRFCTLFGLTINVQKEFKCLAERILIQLHVCMGGWYRPLSAFSIRRRLLLKLISPERIEQLSST